MEYFLLDFLLGFLLAVPLILVSFGFLRLPVKVYDYLVKTFPTIFPRSLDSPATTANYDPYNFSLPVRQEAFSGVLETEKEYDVTVSGVVDNCFSVTKPNSYRIWYYAKADTFYYQDNNGNFTHEHSSLRIDATKSPADLIVNTDRQLHSYTLRVMGDGKKLGLCFDPGPLKRIFKRTFYADPRYLRVTIQEAAENAAARVEAEERAKKEKAEAERLEPIYACIQQLEADKRYRPHRADSAYLENFVAVRENRDDLFKRSAAIMHDCQIFNEEVVPVLREQGRDDLIPFGEWEVRALAIAERLDVETPPPPPERPRRTFEEVRAKAVRYLQEKNSDLIAETVAIGEDIETSCTALDHLNLDPEIKQQLVQGLVDRIVNREIDNENSNKKVV